MLILALEISNPGAAIAPGTGQSVAIGQIMPGPDGVKRVTVLAREPVAAPSRHDDDLQPAIDRASSTACCSPRDLAAIAVSIGPGGFTALRVAVAAAKMIALASKARAAGDEAGGAAGASCIGVPTALAAAMSYRLNSAQPARLAQPIAVALAGKSDAAFVTIITPADLDPRIGGPQTPPEGRICGAGDLAGLQVHGNRISILLADSHLPAALRDAADTLGMSIVALHLDAVAVLHAAALVEPIDWRLLTPLYGREPEAVTLWRQRRASASTP